MATISTHNGCQVAREHNLRNPKVASKESHIDPNGIHEVWVDESPRAAYKRLFSDAVDKYNQKQKRPERRIEDYYKKVKEDKKKHTVYELIAGVYDKEVPFEIKKKILREYADGWSKRNPNLELIGAYFHADELGEEHLHLDYIPVARGCKRGLETQTALVKALEQQGIEAGSTMKETAQILWERAENSALESICQEYGVEVEHPQKGKGSHHLETENFKLKKENEKLQTENEKLKGIIDHNRDIGRSEIEQIKAAKAEKEAMEDELKEVKATLTKARELQEISVLDRLRIFIKEQHFPQTLEDFALKVVDAFESLDARGQAKVKEWIPPKRKGQMLDRGEPDR